MAGESEQANLLGVEQCLELLLRGRSGPSSSELCSELCNGLPARASASPIDPNVRLFYVVEGEKKLKKLEGTSVKYNGFTRSQLWWSDEPHLLGWGVICRKMSLKPRKGSNERHGLTGYWLFLAHDSSKVKPSEGVAVDTNNIQSYVVPSAPSLVQFWPMLDDESGAKRPFKLIPGAVMKRSLNNSSVIEGKPRSHSDQSYSSSHSGASSYQIFPQPEPQPQPQPSQLYQQHQTDVSYQHNSQQQERRYVQIPIPGSPKPRHGESVAQHYVAPLVSPAQRPIDSSGHADQLPQRKKEFFKQESADRALDELLSDPQALEGPDAEDESSMDGLEAVSPPVEADCSPVSSDVMKHACEILSDEEFQTWYVASASDLFSREISLSIEAAFKRQDPRIMADFMYPPYESCAFEEGLPVGEGKFFGGFSCGFDLNYASDEFCRILENENPIHDLQLYEEVMDCKVMFLFQHLLYKQKHARGQIDPLDFWMQIIVRVPSGRRSVIRMRLTVLSPRVVGVDPKIQESMIHVQDVSMLFGDILALPSIVPEMNL